MIKKLLLFLFFIITPIISLFANDKSETEQLYKIRRVSPEGGLGINGQRDVRQDKWGFIWVITVHDLYRFDGYTFKHYTDKLNKPNASIVWSFNRLEVDKDGNIYVTSNFGLLKYNPLTDNFDNLFQSGTLLVKEDINENLWVSNYNTIGIFDRSTHIFTPIESGEGETKNLSAIFIKGENIFLGTGEGKIYLFDNQLNMFKLVFSNPQYNIVDINQADSKLYVLTENSGLIVIDSDNYSEIKQYDFFYPEGDRRVSARALYIDKFGCIWVTSQRGIYIINPETDKYSHYYYDKTDPYGLPGSSVWRISEDNQENLWFGTYSGGLCFINLNEKKNLKTFNGLTDGLSYPVVSSFAEDDNYIWIGTEGGGLNKYDKKTHSFSYLNHTHNKNSLSYDNIQSLLLIGNKLWIGMSRGGLDCLDTQTGLFTHYGTNGSGNSLLNLHVERMVAQGDSGIWIKYLLDRNNLTYLSIKDNKTEHFNFLNPPIQTNGGLNDIVKGNGDTLWISTSYQLLMMDVSTRNVSFAKYDYSDVTDFQHINILTICADNKNNILWLGTNRKGLLMYDVYKKSLLAKADLSKYDVHSIYSLNMDAKGNLWMGTNNGLFHFNFETDKLQQFNKADGAQGRTYYSFATYKSKSGDLYFGGNEGFTIIDPLKVTRNEYSPHVIISEFMLDNEPVIPGTENSPLESSIFRTKELKLKYNQNNFTFEFSSDNYLNPEKNRFRYRLKGYDDRWVETDAAHRAASYAKVPRGKYNFEIMTANNDEEWGELTSLSIVVYPAPWFSIWAILGYIIFLSFISYMIIRYYNSQRKLKMQFYLEEKEREQKEEYHQAQLKFFTNVSHDFRTPLSLIIGAIDTIKSGNISNKYLSSLDNNAHRLMNLINELMDFRSLQNKKVKLNLQKADWNEFVEENSSDFFEYAQYKNILFKTIFDPVLSAEFYFDSKVMEKILLNLLNNAFKYTSEGGEITVTTLADIGTFKSSYTKSFIAKPSENEGSLFGLVISDNGVGISEISIEYVFERYYRVNESTGTQHLGSGIGLALVKSLVELHKGYIAIYSEREKGTDILIGFPTDATIYQGEDFDSDNNGIELSDSQSSFTSLYNEKIESALEEDTFLSKNRKSILLVEDNDELREFLADMLRENYDIYEVSNGFEALQFLEEEDIDLILTDVMMPRINGIELTKTIKENLETSHIPVVMLTARTGTENQIEGLHSGADVYLEKPVNKQILLLNLSNLFKQQVRIREYYAKHYFAQTNNEESPINKRDADFMNQFIEVVDNNLSNTEIDVLQIASALAMSRRKLYGKVKALTGQSVVEFIRNYRLRKAAQILIEENISISTVMERVGIDNASYFSRIFKKEFGESPSDFASKYHKN